MKRRDLVQWSAAIAAAGTLSPTLVMAQQTLTKGKDYLEISAKVAVDVPKGKVEVIEFFGYFCPHCNAFEPLLEQWLKKLPPYIVFKRVPVAFDARAKAMQQLYYTLEAMGKVESHHKQVFAAIHVNKKKLLSDKDVLDWAKGSGLDFNTFKKTYESFAVAAKPARATQLVNAFQVTGVPSFGVQGRYYIDGELSKTSDRALKSVEILAAQLQKSA
jgi:thiol:disulfide interchange protein DsbA